MNNLEYYVYNENVNTKEIEKYNVFRNSRFYEGVCKAVKQYKKDQDLNSFKEEVRHQLMYSFWSKCEYEVVITSWPPYMDVENIDKLKQEVEEHDNKYNKWKQLRVNVPLTIGEKISVYDQVMLNLDVFISYLLENIKLIQPSGRYIAYE